MNPEPGGVNWITRQSSPVAKSASSRHASHPVEVLRAVDIRDDGVLPIQVGDARLLLAVGQIQRTCFAHEVRARACWFAHKDGTGVSLDLRRQALGRRGCFPADDHEQRAATATENENGTPRSLKSKESAASLFSSSTISRSLRRRVPRAF